MCEIWSKFGLKIKQLSFKGLIFNNNYNSGGESKYQKFSDERQTKRDCRMEEKGERQNKIRAYIIIVRINKRVAHFLEKG